MAILNADDKEQNLQDKTCTVEAFKASSSVDNEHIFKPTQLQILFAKRMGKVGVPHRQIARNIINPNTGNPISLETFTKYFAPHIDAAQATANYLIGGKCFELAANGDPGMIKFWLSRQGEWREALPLSLDTTFDALANANKNYQQVLDKLINDKESENEY